VSIFFTHHNLLSFDICYKSSQIQKVAKNSYVAHHNLTQTAFGAFLCVTRASSELIVTREKTLQLAIGANCNKL